FEFHKRAKKVYSLQELCRVIINKQIKKCTENYHRDYVSDGVNKLPLPISLKKEIIMQEITGLYLETAYPIPKCLMKKNDLLKQLGNFLEQSKSPTYCDTYYAQEIGNHHLDLKWVITWISIDYECIFGKVTYNIPILKNKLLDVHL